MWPWETVRSTSLQTPLGMKSLSLKGQLVNIIILYFIFICAKDKGLKVLSVQQCAPFNILFSRVFTLYFSHKGSLYWKPNARKIHAVESSAFRQWRRRSSRSRCGWITKLILSGEGLNWSINRGNNVMCKEGLALKLKGHDMQHFTLFYSLTTDWQNPLII